MKSIKIKNFLIFNLAIIFFLGVIQVPAQTAKTIKTSLTIDKISETQKKAIENIVRDYLLKNPSIIREATQALQIKEAKEKQELATANMKRFQKDIFDDPNTPTAGNDKAEVSIVAFFDYNCGYCKSSLPILNEMLAKDPSIRIVYKEYPILSQSSQLGAKAALAAQIQGKYLEFHNALVASAQINEDSIKTIANQLGLNYEKLQKDMNDKKINDYLISNYNLANSLNIEGTPAYIVGSRLIPGAVDLNSLTQIVEAERAKLSKPKSANETLTAK